MNRLFIKLVLGLTLITGGCQQPAASDMTFSRGAQLLASGSPKSAIPFLSQTVASTPDGPEPIAMLALAYALDLQPDLAIRQALLVRRPKDAPPGWERVAVGIAEITRRRPADAIANFQQVLDTAPPDSPLLPASRQWLILAQILKGDHALAEQSLQTLAQSPAMQPCASLWTAILHTYYGKTTLVTQDLVQCAITVVSASGQQALARSLASADDQTLYDAAVAAVAKQDLQTAQRLFSTVEHRSPDACDAPVWLALLAGAGLHQDPQEPRSLLKKACESGSMQSRGLANQLFSVVCALEDRPEEMIQCILAGQRMLGRNGLPQRTVEQPKPESVWFSDHMK